MSQAQKLVIALLDNNVSELAGVSTTKLNTHGRIFCSKVRKMEQSTYKAERRTIYLGDIPLEVAMLPNGDYCLSQTQVAGAINKAQYSIVQFFRSKYFKGISDSGLEVCQIQEKLVLEGANKPINPVSLDVACLYWQKWAAAGNEKAQLLVIALLKHSIYDLADQAFNVKRTTEAKNQAMIENLNSDPNACLESLDESENILKFPEQETLTERELKFKIKVAQLELEKIKSLEQPYDSKEIRKLGAFSPEVVIDIKNRLKLKSWEQTKQFLEKVGFGKESGKWVEIKISGAMPVLPWHSVKELQQICSTTSSTQIKKTEQ